MSDDLILADAIYAAGQALHADACTEGDPHRKDTAARIARGDASND